MTSTPHGAVIAILGAESTGKTTLALALGQALRDQGHDCAVIPETLREWCDHRGRTPRREEQAGIARAHGARIDDAAAAHALVVADTTALQIAVYSEQVFCDRSLYDQALKWQRGVRLSLLTALDLPWRPDGLQRDGPHVREPVDGLLRQALHAGGIEYAVIAGTGPQRLAHALAAVERRLGTVEVATDAARWHWPCERCGDAGCERHLLPRV